MTGSSDWLREQLSLLLDPSETRLIAARLAAESDDERGFPTQHFGVDSYSIASAGICGTGTPSSRRAPRTCGWDEARGALEVLTVEGTWRVRGR